jgi:hypothetical protein
MFMQMDDHNNTMGVKHLVGEIRNNLDVLKSETQDFMLLHSSAIKSLKKNTEQVILDKVRV